MKGLFNFLQKNVKPHFEEGGKLKRFHVVYDGLETFAFVPPHTTHNGSHIRDGIDLKRTMFMVVLALVPCILFGMFNVGHQHLLAVGEIGLNDPLMTSFWSKIGYGAWRLLPLIVVSYSVGLGIEFFFAAKRGHSIHEGFLVSGLLIPLIMPPNVPLWMVAIATAFAVIIAKEVFGGTGMNILNVALVTRAFLFFAYPTKMSGEVWTAKFADSDFVDGYTGASVLGELAETVGKPIETVTGAVSGQAWAIVDKLESGVYSTWNLFLGLVPGSIGETSAAACLLGGIFLIAIGIASWRVILSFFAGGLAMAYLFNAMELNFFMTVDPIQQLMMGGFMFGMVFMATDPVTAAQTNTGKIIYGFFGGFLSIMIRVFNPAYPEGVMMAILFMNVMAPMIDHYVVGSNIKRRLKRAALARA